MHGNATATKVGSRRLAPNGMDALADIFAIQILDA